MVAKKKKTTTKTKKVDVLAHVLVPNHTILTKKETGQLLKDYSIRLVNLPRIFEDDPAAQALGAKEGSVIKVTRESDTIVDKVETYRFVTVRKS
ncbi:MAG: DNA-directed RNA polymerase subunit H [Promethearchaeota archaeon]